VAQVEAGGRLVEEQHLMRRDGAAGGELAQHPGELRLLHDLNLAAAYADALLVMQDGRLVARGAPAAVLRDWRSARRGTAPDAPRRCGRRRAGTAPGRAAPAPALLEEAVALARRGAAVVAILHDLNLAAAYADALLVMQATVRPAASWHSTRASCARACSPPDSVG
jgi:hypothetical protein